ncbi:SNARE associated Golgi protein [Babesia ovata]|uniref:SNARE associated Golgi protein n=1 Tax=Babesia ovata TaxID=189622 RepID=A0A2H6KAN7_9APIC|nr:SNARE associated Golgi protein [Babesia ovata]GBE60046.1 SNARE associated Golgi protein [Babesia ovata]
MDNPKMVRWQSRSHNGTPRGAHGKGRHHTTVITDPETFDNEGINDDVVSSAKRPLLEQFPLDPQPNPWLPRIIIGLWLVMTPLAIYYRKEITDFVRAVAVKGAEQGSLLYVYFVLLFILAVMCCVSLEIMIISGGFIFTHLHGHMAGVAIGTGLSFVAYFITMLICFLISRYVLKGIINRYLRHYKYYGALIRATELEGLSLVAMVRLSPFFPPTLVSYIFGSTNVSARHYCLASFAAIPSITFFTYIGSLIENISDETTFRSSEIEYRNRDVPDSIDPDNCRWRVLYIHGDEASPGAQPLPTAGGGRGERSGLDALQPPSAAYYSRINRVRGDDDDGSEGPIQCCSKAESRVLVLSAERLREVEPHDTTETNGEPNHETDATSNHDILGPFGLDGHLDDDSGYHESGRESDTEHE